MNDMPGYWRVAVTVRVGEHDRDTRTRHMHADKTLAHVLRVVVTIANGDEVESVHIDAPDPLAGGTAALTFGDVGFALPSWRFPS